MFVIKHKTQDIFYSGTYISTDLIGAKLARDRKQAENMYKWFKKYMEKSTTSGHRKWGFTIDDMEIKEMKVTFI